MQKERCKHIAAVYVVLKKDGHILFHRRKNSGYFDGFLGIPSGHVEENESLMQALCREIQEELNVELHPEDARIVHIRHRNAEDGSRLDFFYTASAWDGEILNNEPEKSAELSWEVDSVSNNKVIPYIRDVLSNIERGILYSDEGWKT